MKKELGAKVSYWSASEKRYVVGVIVKANTFNTMYEIDIGNRKVWRHRDDLWPAN
jgi:hypothetical protein